MTWVFTGIPTSILTTLGLSLGAALVVLYVLRVRRQRVEVPFSPLWASVLAERKANDWWERLKRLFSLLIQLLLLAVLLLALADPRTEDAVEEGRSVVLLIDTSASMLAAADGSPSRFELARERVAEQIALLGPRDEAMLVTADARLRPLTPFTADVDQLQTALASIEPTATSADLDASIQFGIDALAGRSNGVLVFASDFPPTADPGGAETPSGASSEGAVGAAAGTAEGSGLDAAAGGSGEGSGRSLAAGTPGIGGGSGGAVESVEDGYARDLPQTMAWLPIAVGEASDNVGISAFNVRRYPSNRTNVEVFVQVRNQSPVAAQVELSLYGQGRLMEVTTFEIEADSETRRTLPDLPTSGDELEARVRVTAGDIDDRFPLDDVAYARLPDARALRVLAVTEGNLYLEAPLLLNESIDVTTVTPTEYTAPNLGDPSADFDVTIFDGVTPDTADVGNFLYLSPEGPFSPWEVIGETNDPIIDSTRRGHSLLRWVSALRDVNITSARRLRLEPADRSVATAIGGAPMIATRALPDSRRIAVAFRPQDSDLPLRVAWPVFLLNALDWFTQDDGSLIESYRTGETWFVPVPDRSTARVEVRSPSGVVRSVDLHGGRIAFVGDEVGFWALQAGDSRWTIAGNLSDARESRLSDPDPASRVRDEPIATLSDASEQLDWEPWLALVALAFLVFFAEWWSWNRRWTV